eukprot:TRINITY_DN10977_c0_g2_i1.p1 TRINITY_DN10977_c0_g2~~TRINITY_DN10977_c0_g2_i1.p1  ORF type:complete len:220 (-),score=13.78 TRINITY_DN10977_c0_g2_i1:111-770(-)
MFKVMLYIMLAAYNCGARNLFQSGLISQEAGVISFVPAPTPFKFCQLNLNMGALFSRQPNIPTAADPCFSDKPQITTITPIMSTTSSFKPSMFSTNTAQQEFSVNKQKWLQSNVRQYSYSVQRICYCPPEASRQIQVEVCDNKLSIVPQQYKQFNTIDKIFQFVEGQFQRNPSNITIQYDSTFGFIKYVSLDQNKFSASEEIGLRVDNFVILSDDQCLT